MRALAVAGLLLVGCDEFHGVTLFAVPGGKPGDDFYATPFPNDLRRKADGTIDLTDFPTNSLLADTYRQAADTLDGFGKNSAMFARFDTGIDPATLPADAAASLADDASVYLVDIDADSPGYGTRTPIIVRFRAEGTATIGPNNLVARPFPGFPLDDATTYALVITNRVREAHGGEVVAAATFSQILSKKDSNDSTIQAAREVYAPLAAYLDEPGGDEREDVISAAVFTTQSATAIAPAIRKGVFATPAPVATNISAGAPTTLTVFTGNYMAPNFQSGEVPYRNPPDGEIKVGADGSAIVQRTEAMRFALTVPNGAVPAGGFPLVIYSHGTGGDFMSFIDDGTANALNAQGLAVISTDQVLHGPRNPGGNEETDFFNVANPYAIRDNILQGAADAWSQLRLAQGLSIPDGGRTITFDSTRMYFFGHSQGGLTGPAFIAFEPSLAGAVLSGTGGVGYLSLLNKTSPVDFPSLVGALLRDDPLDNDNPSLALAQLWAERSDGVNYAPLMVRTPPTVDGTPLAPRNIYQTEGFTDTFTPNPCIEAFATALGGDIVKTAATADVPGLDLRERTVMTPPFSNNLNGATAVLAQYKQLANSDGHFVVFDLPTARNQAAKFLGTLAATGTATVVDN